MSMSPCDLNTEDLSTIIATGLLFSPVSIPQHTVTQITLLSKDCK